MRTVELVPGICSSVLGFGCGPILGSVDGASARRALNVALEEGVTHFDVARSYGYGEAEEWLGRELRGRRDQVVLATKFGIVASPAARWLRPLKPVVRWVKHLKDTRPMGTPAAMEKKGTLLPSVGDRFHQRVPLEPDTLRKSVESSLRALRTDHLDYLFLHEPCVAVERIDALAEMVIELKQAGKLRAWGLAFMREKTVVHAPSFARFDILQCDLAPGAPDYEVFRRQRSATPSVFFSPFRGAASGIPRSAILRRLSDDFPLSVILCSMFNPDHIRANARSLK